MTIRFRSRALWFSYRTSALLAVAAFAACEDEPLATEESVPPGVVLLIGDGMGEGALEAGRLVLGGLAMETLPVHLHVRTRSATHDVTDSGAASTAYACGVSTHNGAVGVDENDEPVETVLEVAEARGWATGLVSTAAIVDATPAAFAAHSPDRGLWLEIAADMSDSGVDVLLGGGADSFDPAMRPDGLDPLDAFRERGCTILDDAAQLSGSAGDASCLVGLFAGRGLPPAGGRSYTLAQMARAALDVVRDDPDGFFVMIEGAQIDWAASLNDGPGLVAEMEDFDGAVQAVLDELASRPNTLIVVTADHEAGGLSAEEAASGEILYSWTTTGHTAANVSLFGSGAGLDGLPGELANHEFGGFLLEWVRGAPAGE